MKLLNYFYFATIKGLMLRYTVLILMLFVLDLAHAKVQKRRGPDSDQNPPKCIKAEVLQMPAGVLDVITGNYRAELACTRYYDDGTQNTVAMRPSESGTCVCDLVARNEAKPNLAKKKVERSLSSMPDKK